MPISQQKLMLFDFGAQTWTDLVSNVDIDNPQWSPDDKYVYYNKGRRVDPSASYRRSELSRDGALLISCWFDGGDIYSLDLEAP
jgi:Tol biopolymer transport system component